MDRTVSSLKVNISGWCIDSDVITMETLRTPKKKKNLKFEKMRTYKNPDPFFKQNLGIPRVKAPEQRSFFFFFLKSERHPCRPEANCSSAARLISSICFLQPSLRNGGCLPWPALSTKQQATRYRAAHPCGGEIPIMVHLVCSMPSGEKPDFSIFIRGFFKLPYFQTLRAQIYGNRGP